jgi:hypothetical protein
MKIDLAELEKAHKHSSVHREEILSSELCGCFYCEQTFPPKIIEDWVDEVNGINVTALCPRRGVDSVIGSKSGFPLTKEFLHTMYQRWF